MACWTVRIFSESSSGMSSSKASSKAITNSTVSSESAPRSSTKDAVGVTSASSTPNCSTMICFTFSATEAMAPPCYECVARFRRGRESLRYQRFVFPLDRRSHLPLARDKLNDCSDAFPARSSLAPWSESQKLRAEVEGSFLRIGLIADAIPQGNLQDVGTGLGVVQLQLETCGQESRRVKVLQ